LIALNAKNNGNLTYCTIVRASIIGHFESDRPKAAINNDHLNKSLIPKLEQLKYGNPGPYQDGGKNIVPDGLTGPTRKGDQGSGESYQAGKLKLTIAKFLIDHQLPYSISEDLMLLTKQISAEHNPKVIQQCNLDRNTASKITRDSLCLTPWKEIISQLELSSFSIGVDESMDLHGHFYLAVAANYLPHTKLDDKLSFGEPTTSLASVIELEESHSGQALYDKLMEEFFL